MAEEKDPAFNASLTLSYTGSKTEIEMRRQKKKKLAAFKTFLDNKSDHTTLEDLPARRKLSDTEMQEQKLEPNQTCKICRQPQQQPKLCEFCKESVCGSHMKKRRRNPDTNRWARICQFCEDKYLMEKHYQNEMKTEESLLSQEAVLRTKHIELSEAIAGKKVKLQMLHNKHEKLLEHTKKESARLTTLQNDVEKKTKKLQTGLRENGNLQLSLMSAGKLLPPSLEADYRFLQQQNLRITTDLVRYQKLCIDAVKTRSKREKQMYDEYYQWQQQRLKEMQEASERHQQEQQQCAIY